MRTPRVGASGAESFAFVRSRSRSSVRSESFALVRSFGIVRGRSFVRPFKTSLVKYSKVGVQRKTTGTRGGTRGYNRRLPNVRRSSRGDAQSWLSREMRGTQACETEPRVRGGDGLDARGGGGGGCGGGGGGGGGGFLGGGDARPRRRGHGRVHEMLHAARERDAAQGTPRPQKVPIFGRAAERFEPLVAGVAGVARAARAARALVSAKVSALAVRSAENPPRRRRDRTRRGRRSRRRRLRRRRLFAPEFPRLGRRDEDRVRPGDSVDGGEGDFRGARRRRARGTRTRTSRPRRRERVRVVFGPWTRDREEMTRRLPSAETPGVGGRGTGRVSARGDAAEGVWERAPRRRERRECGSGRRARRGSGPRAPYRPPCR